MLHNKVVAFLDSKIVGALRAENNGKEIVHFEPTTATPSSSSLLEELGWIVAELMQCPSYLQAPPLNRFLYISFLVGNTKA